ncbi:MAG: double zinc ribbon domain-containing protein [Streptosporangiaceae bacterium]
MPAPPAHAAQAAYPPAGQGAGSRLARFLRTGWTCPACGKGGVPSDKFCTKCGTPIQPIRPDAAPEPERAPRPRPTCSTCANPLGPMDAFCSKCGGRR